MTCEVFLSTRGRSHGVIQRVGCLDLVTFCQPRQRLPPAVACGWMDGVVTFWVSGFFTAKPPAK